MRPTAGLAVALLILLAALPAASGQTRAESKEFTIGDGEGDVKPRGMPPPGGAPLDWLDLKGLRIYDEDMEGVWVELTIKDLKRPPNLFFGSTTHFTLRFKLDGSGYTYTVIWSSQEGGGFDNQTPSYRVQFCVRTSGDVGYGGGCYPRQRTFGGADYTKNRVWAYLPKLSMMGKDPVDGNGNTDLGIQLPQGAKLSGIYATSVHQNLQLEDRLPDTQEGGPYELQQPAANDRIRIKLTPKAENQTRDDCPPICSPSPTANQDYARVSVEPGLTTLVKLDVVNLNGAKRIVNLSAQLGSKDDSKKWEVRIAPGVQIPGSEKRTVNLVVNATSAVTHRESTLVRIIGVSYLFKDEIGSLTLRLVASVPPSVEQTSLYFHASKPPAGSTISGCSIPFFGGGGQCQPTRWLNTLETDPTADLDATGDERGRDFYFGSSQIRYTYGLDAALSRDVVLDVKKPFMATINIKSSFALDGSLEVRVSAGGKGLGSIRSSINLPQGGGAANLNFLPLVDSSRIKAGDKITVDVILSYDNVGAGAGSIASQPFLLPKGSRIVFPITTDPNVTAQGPVPAGEAFLGLTRHNKEDNEFANPARARVFEMTVVNEGGLEDVATITTFVTSGACEVEVRPGTSFKLEAGDSAKFGVLLRPAADAKEGSQCHVSINATSRIDPAITVTQRVYIIVTTNLDLPDDSKTYLPDKDSEAKAAAASPRAKSPTTGLLAALAVLGVVAARRRRA